MHTPKAYKITTKNHPLAVSARSNQIIPRLSVATNSHFQQQHHSQLTLSMPLIITPTPSTPLVSTPLKLVMKPITTTTNEPSCFIHRLSSLTHTDESHVDVSFAWDDETAWRSSHQSYTYAYLGLISLLTFVTAPMCP